MVNIIASYHIFRVNAFVIDHLLAKERWWKTDVLMSGHPTLYLLKCLIVVLVLTNIDQRVIYAHDCQGKKCTYMAGFYYECLLDQYLLFDIVYLQFSVC